MSTVQLAIYEFYLGGFIPATHTEIVIHNMSLGYSENGTEVSNMTNLDGQDGYKLLMSISLGRTNKSRIEIRDLVLGMDDQWQADAYNIFSKNCRHYSLTLIDAIRPNDADEGRRVLGNLIALSEGIGYYFNIITTNMVRLFPLNPITIASFVLGTFQLFSNDRILEYDTNAKWQLLMWLTVSNMAWITFLGRSFYNAIQDDDGDELVNAIEQMEL